MNYSLLVVLLIATSAFCQQQTCWSEFSSTDGQLYEVNAGWLNGTDQDGNLWFFRICDFYDDEATVGGAASDVDEINPCGSLDTPTESVTVCQSKQGQLYVKGTDDTVRYSDSPNGSGAGFEIMYGVETATPAIKTLIELNCDYEQDGVVNVTNIDDSFTIITYTGYQCCPIQMIDGSDDAPIFEPRQNFAPIAMFYLMVLCSAFFFVCCCCTCLVRRRRCQQQKAVAMKQFSNVAFQPIPHSNNTVKSTATVTPQNVPTYNPYLNQQPQFVYYYPSAQNGSTTQFPFVHPQFQQPQQQVKQENSDEKIARELQAQFDREL